LAVDGKTSPPDPLSSKRRGEGEKEKKFKKHKELKCSSPSPDFRRGGQGVRLCQGRTWVTGGEVSLKSPVTVQSKISTL
jgi:hypothetical protein